MKSKSTRSKHSRTRKNGSIKKRGGGWFDGLLGVQRIRGQKYEHWLEGRLVLMYEDIDYVNKVRNLFGYDKTALYPFTYKSVLADACGRKPEDRVLMLTNKQGVDLSKTFCPTAPAPPPVPVSAQ